MKFAVIALIFFLSFIHCQMMGGWTIQDPHPENNSKLEKIIEFLLQRISEDTASLKPEKWFYDECLSYQTQIVAGTNHKLVIQIKNASGFKKVVSGVIFESLSSGDLVLSRYFEIISSKDNNFNNIVDNELLLDLKNKIVHLHEYYSEGSIQYHIRRIRWALFLKNQNDQEIYHVNCELEGTNNEVSLWEHWFKKVQNKNAIEASLLFVKLPLATFRTEEFLKTNKCDSIVSYLLCGLYDCSNKDFLKSGKCQ